MGMPCPGHCLNVGIDGRTHATKILVSTKNAVIPVWPNECNLQKVHARALCVEAYEQFTLDGVRAQVVSMPSWALLDDHDKCYRESVFPPNVRARVSVEEASDYHVGMLMGLNSGDFTRSKVYASSIVRTTCKPGRFRSLSI